MPVPIARDRHFRLSKNTVRFVVRNTVFQRKQGHKAEETRKKEARSGSVRRAASMTPPVTPQMTAAPQRSERADPETGAGVRGFPLPEPYPFPPCRSFLMIHLLGL